jgi:hypothetical protein
MVQEKKNKEKTKEEGKKNENERKKGENVFWNLREAGNMNKIKKTTSTFDLG